MDDETLARLAHLNYVGFGRDSALWSDAGAVEEAGGVLLHRSGTEFPFVFNGVYRADPASPPPRSWAGLTPSSGRAGATRS